MEDEFDLILFMQQRLSTLKKQKLNILEELRKVFMGNPTIPVLATWAVTMEFNFKAIQLNRLNWRDVLNQSNPVAAALMSKMKIDPADRPRVKVECLRLLATLQLNPAKSELFSGFVDTYLRLTVQKEQAFQAAVGTLEAS
jgi:hypothetical protein